MEDLVPVIANLGFPIAVAVYLLVRIESKLTQLTNVIVDLKEAIITAPLLPGYVAQLHLTATPPGPKN